MTLTVFYCHKIMTKTGQFCYLCTYLLTGSGLLQ